MLLWLAAPLCFVVWVLCHTRHVLPWFKLLGDDDGYCSTIIGSNLVSNVEPCTNWKKVWCIETHVQWLLNKLWVDTRAVVVKHIRKLQYIMQVTEFELTGDGSTWYGYTFWVICFGSFRSYPYQTTLDLASVQLAWRHQPDLSAKLCLILQSKCYPSSCTTS